MIATEQFDCLPIEEVSSMLGSIQVKEYPIFDVQKGVLTKKKVKYHNYDDEEIEIKFECEQSQYCTANEKIVKIPPKGLDFLRIRILVPSNCQEHQITLTVDAHDNHTGLIKQKIVFKLNVVNP
ncbi:unnamed protein product [Paramecium sonneborni]|uniref:Uncharacterized protein n=1 Tax=Paramecium sonneborni TaxID=65129 RepID=A0A8S1N979_9CILI|nr:unnamed protein product [Paramecium sonneborni]